MGLMLLKSIILWSEKARRLYHKRRAQALDNADTFERNVHRQASGIGWVIFAADERRQVVATGCGDAESVGGYEIARQLLFLIGDGTQGCFADAPAIRLG